MSQLVVDGKLSIPKSRLCVEFFDQLVVEASSVVSIDQRVCPPQVCTQTPASAITTIRPIGADDSPGELAVYAGQARQMQNKPKRPMNAFMVWAQMIRRELHKRYNNVQNALLSKSLGRIWRTLDASQKEQFIERANWIKSIHKYNYPNYRNQPRRIAATSTDKEAEPMRGAANQPNYYTPPAYYPTSTTRQDLWDTSEGAWYPSEATVQPYYRY